MSLIRTLTHINYENNLHKLTRTKVRKGSRFIFIRPYPFTGVNIETTDCKLTAQSMFVICGAMRKGGAGLHKITCVSRKLMIKHGLLLIFDIWKIELTRRRDYSVIR